MPTAPYFEKMTELFDQAPMFDSGADESGGKLPGKLKRFVSDKIESAGVCCLTGEESFQYGLCLVNPKADYGLPVFVSIWEEHADTIRFVVDLMPTVDTLVNEPYRKKYIEPLNDAWDRFSNLPGICPEEDDELRSACSIVATAARVPVDKEGLRLAALAPHTQYLSLYLDFLQSEEPMTDSDQRRHVKRKKAAVLEIVKTHVLGLSQTPAGQALEGDVLHQMVSSLL